MSVVGRLAPSPTGRLHVGNLASALLAWLQVRRAGGRLVLRIEDIDTPRCVAEAEPTLIEDLRWLGVDWDEGPLRGGSHGPYRQSERQAYYERGLATLIDAGLAYPCFCSRREVQEVLSAPHASFPEGTQYPGTCAALSRAERSRRAAQQPHAIRFRAQGRITVHDGIAGTVVHDLTVRPGDFVIRRKDGLFAYQLVVVLDDLAMGVTDIVRGRDLLDSTPRQLALFDAFGGTRPRTWHHPLLVDTQGDKLSKRSASTARDGLAKRGWTPAALIGAFCVLFGWKDRLVPHTPEAAISLWDPTTLAAETIQIPDAFFDGPEAFARWCGSR